MQETEIAHSLLQSLEADRQWVDIVVVKEEVKNFAHIKFKLTTPSVGWRST